MRMDLLHLNTVERYLAALVLWAGKQIELIANP